MRQRMFLRVVPFLLLGCLAFAALPGMADAIADTLTVNGPTGATVHLLTIMQSDESPGGITVWIGVSRLADPAQFGNAIALCDAAPCNASTLVTNGSDIVGVVQPTPGAFYLGFFSDEENGIASGTETDFGGLGNDFRVEPPGPIDVTKYLLPTLQSAGWTATFISDVVPEPSSLLLLGTGLLSVMGISRRFHR